VYERVDGAWQLLSPDQRDARILVDHDTLRLIAGGAGPEA
jgi:hypothetical protein